MIKKIFLIIGILFINSIIINTSINGYHYELKHNENDVFSYKIVSFNEDLAEQFYGTSQISKILGSNARVGNFRFYKINKIEQSFNNTSKFDNNSCEGWKINVEEWDWLSYLDWRNRVDFPDNIFKSLEIYSDPINLGKNISTFDQIIFPYLIPTPVCEYLQNIEWDDSIQVDKNIISQAQQSFTEGIVILQIIINANGILNDIKLITSNHHLIYEIKLENLPINLPNFLILSSILLLILTIMCIFIWKRKIY